MLSLKKWDTCNFLSQPKEHWQTTFQYITNKKKCRADENTKHESGLLSEAISKELLDRHVQKLCPNMTAESAIRSSIILVKFSKQAFQENWKTCLCISSFKTFLRCGVDIQHCKVEDECNGSLLWSTHEILCSTSFLTYFFLLYSFIFSLIVLEVFSKPTMASSWSLSTNQTRDSTTASPLKTTSNTQWPEWRYASWTGTSS